MRRFHFSILALLTIWFVWQSCSHTVLASDPNFSNQNIPQRLVIPAIDLNNPVVTVGLRTTEIDGQAYLMWDTTTDQIGWHQDSGLPGQIGNTVLSGHSNGGGEVFRRLDDIELGSDIFIQTGQGWHHYRVAQKLILKEQGQPVEVRAANAQWILPTEDERLTLVTCWPYPASTHRLLVIAFPVPQEPVAHPPLNDQSESTDAISAPFSKLLEHERLMPGAGQKKTRSWPQKTFSLEQQLKKQKSKERSPIQHRWRSLVNRLPI